MSRSLRPVVRWLFVVAGVGALIWFFATYW
ncbi:hypothetical protein OKW46_002559 [Paraburkholderia sp. WSM4179]|nr:hypothetical protein [Paraburkholderia sp. WSM4179]